LATLDPAALRDPLALLDSSAAPAVQLAIRAALAGALHWVFGAAAVISLFGLAGSLVWREIPMRRSSRSTSSGNLSPARE